MNDRQNNYISDTEARFRIPVKGSHGKGHLLILATPDQTDNTEEKSEFKLRLCELEVKETDKLLPQDYDKKRLVVFSQERHGDIKQYKEKLNVRLPSKSDTK